MSNKSENQLSPLLSKILTWIVPGLLGIISFFMVNVWNDIQDMNQGLNQMRIDQKELFVRLAYIEKKVYDHQARPH